MANKALVMLALSLLAVSIAGNDYQVVKRRVEKPISHFLQYYLLDWEGKEISSWADIDINFKDDTLMGVI